jgi:hypothetical protein
MRPHDHDLPGIISLRMIPSDDKHGDPLLEEFPRRGARPLPVAGGVLQETQGQRSTKGCSAYRLAYRAGHSAQEDKARPSVSLH